MQIGERKGNNLWNAEEIRRHQGFLTQMNHNSTIVGKKEEKNRIAVKTKSLQQ